MKPSVPFDIAQADALAGVPHGFFGSANGAHQFGFGGPGDQAEMGRLRSQAAHSLVAGARLLAPHQVHSPYVVVADAAWEDLPEGRPTADAVVTDQPGLVLGVVTADCAPVLFADADRGVVGAAHAGWRGAQGGVLENTLNAMQSLGADPSNISAAVGPTIGQASYEVDAPFREHFEPEDDGFFAEGRPGHWQFDLPGYIAARLARSGLTKIALLDLDTFSNSARYHSYRRSQQTGEADYGRQISLIAIP
jgi:hypothetical protein